MYTLHSIVVIFSSYYNSLAVHTVFSVQINMKIPEKHNNQKQLNNCLHYIDTFVVRVGIPTFETGTEKPGGDKN